MLGLVFPHQCFKEIPPTWNEIWFIRHDIAYGGKQTTVANFHIARKVFFRAAEKAWISHIKTTYPDIKIRIFERCDKWSTKKTQPVECWDPVDRMLEAQIRKQCPKVQMLETPAFLLSQKEALEIIGDDPKKHDSHAAFYAEMRKRTGILMTRDGKPEGGKFRFDTENRSRVGDSVKLPDWDKELASRQSKWIKETYEEVSKEGPSLGEWTGSLVFPVTHADTKTALDRFLKTRLGQFGPYQDAIQKEDDFLFHAVLSAPINAGLLTPAELIQATLQYAKKHTIPLPSLEGFLAQVIGWREFMRAVYLKRPLPPTNRLSHTRSLGPTWYEGNTGLDPVDIAIERVRENAYLHHIERLMVVGNAMFLCEIDPDEIYRWFMEMFADSYDWVMIGNVYYMSQWASDAITTKPYISSSAYIRKMSNYKGGEWTKDWDALYWAAIARHATLIRKNYRMAAQVAFWERKKKEDQEECLKRVATLKSTKRI